ncbi:multicomponent Na+:H+ antiporter subunit D [Methanophagales archaeon]|nr:multicomponent Na+:H+ antiporter subunit D [Methanophagales archaeon]
MIEWLHPGLIYIFGALLIPVLKGRWQKAYMLMLPIVALIDLTFMTEGTYWSFPVSDYVLTFGRVDKLSLIFAFVFVIASFCMTLYALHVKENGQHVAAFLYIGGALGVVFAGDLFSLYIFWEIMAWASLCLIWYRKTKASSEAGFRYIMVHLFGGICLLAGIILYVQSTGSIAFNVFDWGLGWGYVASYFILIGFLINAAVPPLHAWLADAYPEATITGAVFLTAFTTKSAVYVLIRGFPNVELLIWLGVIMALYGVVFAVLENDIRRLLAYHIISQVGYMVAGVGIGTAMAINGASAHAFCHILYKALLFMGAGAVIEMTGRSKFTELGGLYKYMPLTFWLYMIGAFSISGVPLFNGFVSKTMIVESAAGSHLPLVWLMLECASIGTFLHTGLKVPYLTWFSRKEPVVEAKEPPTNMLAAMGITAFLCVFIGVYPQALYRLLPYTVEYAPYAPAHVIGMSQLLLITFVGFWALRSKLHGTPTITLDTDWFYRKAGKRFIWFCEKPLLKFATDIDKVMKDLANSFIRFSRNPMAASMILITATSTRLLTPFNPAYRQKGQELVEARKQAVEEPMEKMSIGMGVLLVLLFFAFYLLIYLTHGVLWA